MQHVAILVISFVPLLAGAHLVVRGASTVARQLGISSLVIGLTLVAFGTSAPELVINLSAAVARRDSIAVGNVLGSNIFNISVVLGTMALVRTLPISRNTALAEIPLAVLAAVVLFVVMSDRWINGSPADIVTRSEGVLLLSFFGIFLAYMALQRGEAPGVPNDSHLSQPPPPPGTPVTVAAAESTGKRVFAAAIQLVGGFALLALGGHGVVSGAVHTARLLGVPEYIIAITIVAGGTSLPELITSIVAVRRGETDLAVGNVVGSNIFNVFLVIGATAVVRPVAVPELPIDHAVHLALSGLLFLFVFTGGGRRIQRWEAMILLLVYPAYMGLQIMRVLPP